MFRTQPHENVPRCAEGVSRPPQPAGDCDIKNGQADRKAAAPLNHLDKVRIGRVVIGLAVPCEPLIFEQYLGDGPCPGGGGLGVAAFVVHTVRNPLQRFQIGREADARMIESS